MVLYIGPSFAKVLAKCCLRGGFPEPSFWPEDASSSIYSEADPLDNVQPVWMPQWNVRVRPPKVWNAVQFPWFAFPRLRNSSLGYLAAVHMRLACTIVMFYSIFLMSLCPHVALFRHFFSSMSGSLGHRVGAVVAQAQPIFVPAYCSSIDYT